MKRRVGMGNDVFVINRKGIAKEEELEEQDRVGGA